MHRVGSRRGADGAGQHADRARGIGAERGGAASKRGPPLAGKRGKVREGRCPAKLAGGIRRLRFETHRFWPGPKQGGGFLQRGMFAERNGVPAPIDEPAVPNGRDRRCDRRLAPGDGAFGDGRGAASARPSRRQRRHIVGAVLAAARIGTVGPHADAPAADIGVERLRPHLEPFQRLFP
ncbi:hypothetical protein X742_02280 [Mesorhizobium sp. LNHC232B00]|nr:hypothetical protein X742_02280 [Mesorhizobium sp. LNHC232B00]